MPVGIIIPPLYAPVRALQSLLDGIILIVYHVTGENEVCQGEKYDARRQK